MTRLAWGLWALTFTLAVVTVVLGRLSGAEDYRKVGTLLAAWGAIQFYATVRAIIASRRPENRIGWLFLIAPALMMSANAAGAYVELAVDRSLPGAVAVDRALSWTWPLGLGLIATLVLLFPDGRLPSPHWRPVGWFTVVWLVLIVPLTTFTPGPLEEPLQQVENPVGIPGFGVLSGIVFLVGGTVILVASITAVVVRLRRGSQEERQQLKWFLSAIAVAVVVLVGIGGIAAAFVPGLAEMPDWLWLLTLALIPASVGIAILRYQLYEIDRIINRAVVYGVLTALLLALYFGIVLALQQVFSSFTGGSDLAIAGSTLAVAALFRPVRSRIQALVDRRFYRGRYDIQQTLEAFSARLREEVGLEALSAELSRVVKETMQPTQVSLWLRRQERDR